VLTTATPLLLKLRTGVAVGALAIVLSACGGTKWGFPYKVDMQQGNWITSEQVARLEKGMTREQVRFILGTPVLQDIFRSNRWDYTYYSKPGYGDAEERKFTVWFKGDVLDHWDGNKQPDRQPFQRTDTGTEATSVAPAAPPSAPSATAAPVAPAASSVSTTPEAGGTSAVPNTSGTSATTTPEMGNTSGVPDMSGTSKTTTPESAGSGIRLNSPGSDDGTGIELNSSRSGVTPPLNGLPPQPLH
jgi:outer membrane protein assembly factor BamE